MKKKIVAPCGIDCFNCELYEDNVTEEFRDRMAATTKIPREMISCAGCSNGNQCLFIQLSGKTCKTLECVRQRGVDYCFQCDEFPCANLMPLADGADRFPQNLKVYNLCTMKRIGVEAWTRQASDIRETYYKKKLVIGEGGSKA